jgi:hypothetical protein
MPVFFAAFVGEFLVKRHFALEQWRFRGATQARDGQAGLRQLDDPAAEFGIFASLVAVTVGASERLMEVRSMM